MNLAFSTICAVHIEDCEGWWLSGCRGSVAEHWQLKPEVSWVRLPAAAGLSLFSPHNIQIQLLFCALVTTKDSTIAQWGKKGPRATRFRMYRKYTTSKFSYYTPHTLDIGMLFLLSVAHYVDDK